MPAIIMMLVVLILAPSAALAQSPIESCDSFKTRIDALVNGTPPPAGQDPVRNLLDIGQGTRCFAEYAKYATERQMLLDLIRRFDSSRSDKQSGTAAGGSGSTSVVSQGPVAKVLSLAAEYGAATQSVSGQVITIRGNGAGLPMALVRQDIVPYCVPQDRSSAFCVGKSALGVLRRFSFAVAFNGTQQTEAVGKKDPAAAASAAGQPVVFEASKNQVSSASLRIELWNQRDVSSAEFRKKWAADVGTKMNDASANLMKRAGGFAEPIFNSDAYKPWADKHTPLIKAAGRDRAKIVKALDAALTELYAIMEDAIPDLHQNIAGALSAYNAFLSKQDEFIGEISTKNVVALELTNNRPSAQPHTSNARLIVDAPITKRDKLVANFAVTWYDSDQINTDGTSTKYRDAQAGVQYEHGLGDVAIIGPATLSAAFYYQYQHAPALLKIDPLKPIPGVTFVGLPDDAKTVFATKGDILLGQVKLSLTPKGSSVKVPVAVTFSNRTELIDKPAWRAQVGVTYDFDSLFSRGK